MYLYGYVPCGDKYKSYYFTYFLFHLEELDMMSNNCWQLFNMIWWFVMWSSKMSRNSLILIVGYGIANNNIEFPLYVIILSRTKLAIFLEPYVQFWLGFQHNILCFEWVAYNENENWLFIFFSNSDSFCFIASHLLIFFNLLYFISYLYKFKYTLFHFSSSKSII